MILGCLLVLIANSALLAQEVFETEKAAQADPDFKVQGEYITDAETTPVKGVQVVALGEGTFRVVVYAGGLPGAGWDRKPPQLIEEEETEAVLELLEALKAKKTQRVSKTMGVKPPKGAVVLFDGTEDTMKNRWKDGARITDEGLLKEGVTSRDTFTDFTAHIEFLLPYMPKARGQGRGNSGAYYQGRYETQILDSFGLTGENNETGGIYTIRKPDLNMCFPPLRWQTYDAEFTAARWKDGKKIANARLTVRLNGVLVQPDVEIPNITRAAPVKESPEPGPLYLQNHGNPVRFRNIWVLPRDADAEARRPIVPGFERFHAASGDAAGGLLLMGELGCVKCHAPGDALAKQVSTKQAPILSQVGNRVRPEWITEFIADPHSVKPGTTMPNLFAGWDDEKRNDAVLSLANFLASSGTLSNEGPNRDAIKRGERLFHSVGCVACHAPRNGTKVPTATTIPLPELGEKYTVPSLTVFLKNPHAVRPSGRMPSFRLEKDEPKDLAQYLLAGANGSIPKNVHYQAFHGDWDNLPDFSTLKPVAEGECAGLDLSVASRNNQFAVRYTGFLKTKAGTHKFWLGSDDGSSLTIDGKELIRVDGIHPHTTKEASIELSAGVHEIRVDYFEKAGEETLRFEFQPPSGSRQNAASQLTTHADGSPVQNNTSENDPDTDGQFAYQHRPELIEKGRELFSSLGCASCHEMKVDGKALVAKSAKAISDFDIEVGCLSSDHSKLGIPDYQLSPAQVHAIASVANPLTIESVTEENPIHQTMAQFNCYACHSRDDIGGPEFSRNPLFLTTQHEMGDEGRVPPPLDGVGDKLQEGWLKRVLTDGTTERTYMQTRMPKFGNNNVVHLVKAFVDHDQKTEAKAAGFDDPSHRIKSTGRHLVGNNALACIKCHTFGNHKATGIQAVSLTNMTSRIRKDWFQRYLFEPAKYRPGTRMPTGFPDGKAIMKEVYDGDPDKQILAVWEFLSDGSKSGIPDGLIAKMIELKPVDEPIIYRNFIEGLTPRAIAVGYPEKVHLAWDANELALRRVWHGRFIDASKHWVGRGPGNQTPLGDHIMDLDAGVPFAVLESGETPWPTESVRKRDGFQFKGYRLNDKGQPSFQYTTPFGSVTDFPEPVAHGAKEGTLKRQFVVNGEGENVYFRAAIGNAIERDGATFIVDDALRVTMIGGGEPFVRKINGKQEVLVPVDLANGPAKLTQTIDW